MNYEIGQVYSSGTRSTHIKIQSKSFTDDFDTGYTYDVLIYSPPDHEDIRETLTGLPTWQIDSLISAYRATLDLELTLNKLIEEL